MWGIERWWRWNKVLAEGECPLHILIPKGMLEGLQLRKGACMPLDVLPNHFNMVGKNAIMIMGAGLSKQAVVVTKAAIKDVRSSPEVYGSVPLPDLPVLRAIASSKFDKGMIAFDGRIWITADDVRAWRSATG
jgi:hypothetical protein